MWIFRIYWENDCCNEFKTYYCKFHQQLFWNGCDSDFHLKCKWDEIDCKIVRECLDEVNTLLNSIQKNSEHLQMYSNNKISDEDLKVYNEMIAKINEIVKI